MHLFIDESGGTDRVSSAFVVAGVLCDSGEAKRTLVRSRKSLLRRDFKSRAAYELRNHELKANMLKPEASLKLIAKGTIDAHPKAAVFLDLNNVGHQQLVRSTREPDLYAIMVVQVIRMLGHLSPEIRGCTIDHGRYKKSTQTRLAQRIQSSFNASISVGFRSSSEVAGLQLADFWANSFYRLYTIYHDARRVVGDGYDVDSRLSLEANFAMTLPFEDMSVFAPLDLRFEPPDWLRA